MEDLPEELKLEILVRLPVKSLVCMKGVSKSWHSRISNPNFAKLLHNLQLSKNYYSQHPNRILLTTSPQLRSIDINASLYDDSNTLNLDFPLLEPDTTDDVHIMGSCRGIVLLQTKQDLFLWNPVTGAYKQIPLPPQWRCITPFVFCYHESIDDYFIGVSYCLNEPAIGRRLEEFFSVLSLGTNSWEKLDLNDYHRIRFPSLGTIFNGAICFIADTRTLSHISPRLIAFDITTKDLQIVAPPTVRDLMYYSELGVHEGCLALACETHREIQVWLMREYGVKSSWTKLISISYHPSSIGYIGYLQPVVFFKEGDDHELFATYYDKKDGSKGLSKWNYKRKLLEHRTYGPTLRQRDSSMVPWRCAFAYTETLLPLP